MQQFKLFPNVKTVYFTFRHFKRDAFSLKSLLIYTKGTYELEALYAIITDYAEIPEIGTDINNAGFLFELLARL